MKLKAGFATLTIVAISALNYFAVAKEKKGAPTSPQLFREIATQDSLLFAAYNAQDINKLGYFFANDLEWFQDNGGLLNRDTVISNFAGLFKKNMGLRRTLQHNSLEVHPIKNYGAIETGVHRFVHREDGKEIVGTFKFMMIWKKKGGDKWQITRVISYDH